MPYVDYFSPMVYPSHYGPGTFGFAVPNDHPYEIIDQTLKIMNVQAAGLPMVIRPWIQDFGYGAFRAYTAAQVRAEMKALRDNGALGWMIWNARALFTEAALGDAAGGRGLCADHLRRAERLARSRHARRRPTRDSRRSAGRGA